MDARGVLGRTGEDLAADLYRRRGYEILSRNFTCREGELDLVARRRRTLVICEVKTRSTDYFGDPSEAVGRSKQARLRKLAAAWLSVNPTSFAELRFDVVSVVVNGRGTKVTLLEDAF